MVDDFKKLGLLVVEEQDFMVVYIKEGFWMFMGCGCDFKGVFVVIIGVMCNVVLLCVLWMLMVMDNLYVDWVLVLYEQYCVEIMKMLKEVMNIGLYVFVGV